MRRVACSAIVFSLVVLSPGRGRGDGAEDRREAPGASTAATEAAAPGKGDGRPTRRRWYGWQVLAADAAMWGVIALQPAGGLDTSLFVGGLGLVIDGPIVHMMNGRGRAALGSLGLRVGLPVLGGLAGLALADGAADEDDHCDRDCAVVALVVVGGAAGSLTASAIDAGALSWTPGTRVDRSTEQARPRAVPTLAITPAGASIGIIGRF